MTTPVEIKLAWLFPTVCTARPHASLLAPAPGVECADRCSLRCSGRLGDARGADTVRSDEQVLSSCNARMSARQSERMSELLARQQAGELTTDERPELWTLLRVYEAGQLRKAEALAEAVRRGPRSPGNA